MQPREALSVDEFCRVTSALLGSVGEALTDKVVAALASAPAAEPARGMKLVPMIPTAEMNRVMDSEGWCWEDLLAAACAITEDEYQAIAATGTYEPAAPASHPQAQVVELPPPRRYWWSPARLAPFVPTWSDNCGPHPDWIVTPYYSADEVRAILDARQEPERPPPWKQYSDELTAREVAQVRKAFEGKT
ncbi:MAG: hypothetical protein DI587_17205 [Variovorax paradoxus]|nr:MAG: hypothetical protein DI583_17205 [Variovorax paradoxus]PZQ08973.1 MAG: hypothetical protein DI587_17205 [Variovorax paradoxus]